MSSGSNGARRYLVSFSHVIEEQIISCQGQATGEGRGDEFINAVRAAFERLQYNPLSFGEPLYRLVSLKLQVRTAAIRPLSIDFAVSDDRPVVYLKAVHYLPAT